MLLSIALAAAVAAQSSSGPKWVPLNKPQARQSQGAAAKPVPLVVVQVPKASGVLPAGTLVSLSPMQEISSKRMRAGQRFDLMVVEDVIENGAIVIPRGSRATGVVATKTGRAIGGKSGKFDISFESVVANGVRFPLNGTTRQEGRGNTVGALLGIIFISGRSATLLPGQVVTAMTSANTAY